MIVAEHFTFASVPKTGCSWFREALAISGIEILGPPDQHLMGREPGKPTITNLRDPATWLASWWMECNGHISDAPILDHLDDLRHGDEDTFEEFVSRYVDQMPGEITMIFNSFKSDYVLRTESLGDDFAELLDLLKVPCLNGARNLPPVNVSKDKRKRYTPVLTDQLAMAIRKAA